MGLYGLSKDFVAKIATQVARFATVYKIVTMAEVVGFELTVPCDTTVFKTAPIDLSGTLPNGRTKSKQTMFYLDPI